METATEKTKKTVSQKTAPKFGSVQKRTLNSTLEKIDAIFAAETPEAKIDDFQREWYDQVKKKFENLDKNNGTDAQWLALLEDARQLHLDLVLPEYLDGSGGMHGKKPTDDENTSLFFEILTSHMNLIFQNQAHPQFDALAKKVNDLLDLGQKEREKKNPDFKPLVEKAYEFEKELTLTLAKKIPPQVDAIENAAAAMGEILKEASHHPGTTQNAGKDTVTFTRKGHEPITLTDEQLKRAANGEAPTRAEKAENAFPVPDDYAFDEAEAEYIDANDLRVIAEGLIQSDNKQFWHLEKVSIRFAWKRKGGRFFGKCESVTGSKEYLSGGKYDFLVWLAADNVRDSQLDRRQVEALVCHELCHIGWRGNGIKLVHHDFEDFFYVVRKYGPILSDLDLALKAFKGFQSSLFE